VRNAGIFGRTAAGPHKPTPLAQLPIEERTLIYKHYPDLKNLA